MYKPKPPKDLIVPSASPSVTTGLVSANVLLMYIDAFHAAPHEAGKAQSGARHVPTKFELVLFLADSILQDFQLYSSYDAFASQTDNLVYTTRDRYRHVILAPALIPMFLAVKNEAALVQRGSPSPERIEDLFGDCVALLKVVKSVRWNMKAEKDFQTRVMLARNKK